MKLKIEKSLELANPKVWLSHWVFTKGQILDTDNEYLINRLLSLKVATLMDKENIKKQDVTENKMHVVEENKNIFSAPKKRGRKPKTDQE